MFWKNAKSDRIYQERCRFYAPYDLAAETKVQLTLHIEGKNTELSVVVTDDIVSGEEVIVYTNEFGKSYMRGLKLFTEKFTRVDERPQSEPVGTSPHMPDRSHTGETTGYFVEMYMTQIMRFRNLIEKTVPFQIMIGREHVTVFSQGEPGVIKSLEQFFRDSHAYFPPSNIIQAHDTLIIRPV